MTKLLVPLDGSNLSEFVLPWAQLLGSEVELLRTFTPLDHIHVVPELPITVAQLVNDSNAEQEIESYLKRQAEKLKGLEVTTQCEVGDPAQVILRHSEQADMVVIASHGASGITRWLLGSVTTKVVRASTKPVLVVSARPEPEPRPTRLKTIFVPLDGSQTAESALDHAAELARRFQAKLVLFEGVVYRNNTPEERDWQALDAKAYLEEQARRIDGCEVEVVVHESWRGPEIVSQSQKHEADMIVMGSHGRSGVSRWVLGSVAEAVIQRSTCPVLIVYDR